MVWIS